MICAAKGCPHPARWHITADDPRTQEHRGLQSCDLHLDHSRRWAAAAGPPDVQLLDQAPPPLDLDQPALF